MDEESGSKINFIPCVKWIKKGIAKANPEKVQLNKDELVRLINETKTNLRITEEAENETTTQPMNVNDEYNFENYDEEEANVGAEMLGLSSLAQIEGEAEDHFSESDDSDKEDDVIKATDNLIVVGRVEGDASILEVHVYNESEEALYVHHDILLPAFPLCLEWLDHEVGHPAGNYCAVGSMSPIIDVWDLDIVNTLEPAFRLGRKPSKKKKLTRIGHSDAVLDLSWNRQYDHILASASVDKTVFLWDLDKGEPATKIEAFSDKVQCLQWHKLEAQTLLAGGSDCSAKIFDCRSPDSNQSWEIGGEAERVAWDPSSPFSFFVATSVGDVEYFDCRKGPVFKIKAHDKEVTGFSVSSQCPGLFVTSSPDEMLKVWDYVEGEQPRLVHSTNLKMGVVHCLELCPELPFVVVSGGDNRSNNFTVLDLQNFDAVKNHFESRPLVQLVAEEAASSTAS